MFDKWNFLLLDRALMLFLVLICMGFVIDAWRRIRFICQLIGRCPFCHKDCLYTVQTCLKCGGTRKYANRLPGEV